MKGGRKNLDASPRGGAENFGRVAKGGGEKFWTWSFFSWFVGILGTFNFFVKGGRTILDASFRGGGKFWIFWNP